MKKRLWMAVLAALFILGLAVYWRYAAGPPLNVDPHAREEIEKAKRR